jgi:hypothetical protein
MKKIIIGIVIVIIIAFIGLYIVNRDTEVTPTPTPTPVVTTPVATTTPEVVVVEDKTQTVLGTSVDGNNIMAYHFGQGNQGDKELLFVGGIHGGYAWNTALVAFELIDYLKANPSFVPANVKVTVVPVLNPDGLEAVVGTTSRFAKSDVPSVQADTVAGRFNANTVDLNRNFDCDWQSSGVWQSKTVSGGTAAFSEPETQAIRNYIESSDPEAVVAFYSAVGGVFASNCHGGVSAETNNLTKMYSTASGYKAYQEFDFYETTGDMTNWLAKIGVPAISILLTNHTDTEFNKNKAGVEALLKYYATK